MVFGMRLKKSPTGKPRVSFAGGRRKETGSGPISSDRRTGSRDGFNRRRTKYESDGDDDYSFRGGNSQSNWKQRENPVRRERQRGENDAGLSGRRPSYGKRRDFTRDGSDGESSSRGGGRGMRPSYGKGRDFNRDGSDGESSSRGGVRGMRPGYGNRREFNRDEGSSRDVSREMRPSYGKRRDFTRDGSNESSSRGGIREMRPSYVKRRDFTRDGSNESSSRGGIREVRPSYIKRRDFTRDGSNESSCRGGVREVRPSYIKRRDFTRDDSKEESSSHGGVHEMRPGYGKRRDFTRDVSKEENSSRGVVREMRPSYNKQRDFTRDGSEVESSSRGVVREMRGERQQRRVDSYDSKETGGSDDFVEAADGKLRMKWKKMDKRRQDVDDSNAKGAGRRGKKDLSVETSDEKLRSKGRQMDKNVSKDRGKSDATERSLEKDTKSEDGNDEIDEKKIMKRQRLIDKSGKKIRIAQKHSDDGSEAKDAPPKRKKRVIKLDPYDFSNKRLDDTIRSIPNTDNAAEKDIESSKNAQFRAIQPSPSILSFVEDNLLGRRRLNELKNAGYNIKLSAPLDNVPFSTCTERDRIEESVFRNKLEFFAAAKISSSFPPPVIPEIAFAGRSNVGKSSLLNALTRQWGVVRTSDKPGLTQTINFFKLDTKLCLVDLPGYGFAYAKEEVKDAWEELVKEYVSTRVGLQKVCLLVDTKWGLKPRDHELIDLMERAQTPYQVVLTKTDVIFPIDVARHAMQIQETLKKNKSIVNPVMMLSSKSGAGVPSLRTVLAKLSRFIKP